MSISYCRPRKTASLHAAHEEGTSPRRKSNREVCTVFFEKKVRSRPNIELNALKKVIVGSLGLVSIILERDDNPYLIFESLNAKGQALTQADLIRNYFFMKMDPEEQEKNYTAYWEPVSSASESNAETRRKGRSHRVPAAFPHEGLVDRQTGRCLHRNEGSRGSAFSVTYCDRRLS